MEVGQFSAIVNSVDDLKNTKKLLVFTENYRNHNWLCQRAILAPKSIAVNEINQQLTHSLPSSLHTCKSFGTIPDEDKVVNCFPKCFNLLDPPELHPHML